MDKKKLVVKCGAGSLRELLTKILLLKYFGVTDLSETQDESFPYSDTDWEVVVRILSNRNLREMARYFMKHGAATALILQNRLNLSERSTYRYLQDLRDFNVIVLAIKTSKQRIRRRGPRSDVWMFPDATIDQINAAQELHRRLRSPKYVEGERLGQLIMDDYLEPRGLDAITEKEVQDIARDQGMKGNLSDIVFFAMNYLHEKGVKAWRAR